LASTPGAGKLNFAFTQAGALTDGQFADFDVRATTTVDGLAGGSLTVVIAVASLDTGDAERDEILHSPDLFDSEKFPEARYTSSTIAATGPNAYEASGTLTIRDQSHPLVLPLTLREVDEAGATVRHLDGSTTIRRLDYDVGLGEWESTEWVANDVELSWSIKLVQQE
jgi:polyisoprenoid-binding protein YceI